MSAFCCNARKGIQMKKILTAIILTALFTGCSNRNENSVSDDAKRASVQETTEANTIAEPTEDVTEFRDADGYHIRVESDGVTVSQGSFLQKIELDCSRLIECAESYNRDPADFIEISDFNFDGYDDMFIPDIIGTPNVPGTYYYMNPTSEFNCFEEWDELNEVGFLMKADSENEVLHFSSSGSAVDHDWIIYKWESGNLQPVSRELQYMNVSDILIDCFEYDDTGKETLVKRKRAVLGENNEWLGTEDVELR